jgi:hypothetical protein
VSELSIISANVSGITVDGKAIPGLQSMEYKVVRNRQNVHNIGVDERIGVDYGAMFVNGNMRVRSTFPDFDKKLLAGVGENKSFQLVVALKKWGKDIRKLTFDECYLEGKNFAMDANGVGVTEYQWTATRLREE